MNTKNIIKPYLLYNQIQPYEWGTRGKQAYIPNLLGIPTEKNKPYAELWMGTHPAAPSQIDFDGGLVELHKVIKTYPIEILGVKTYTHFGANLPFLFKVLSAGQALSIQAHPNRKQAIQLHSNDPQHYPDQNHKPEIAIALDELTVLLGLLDPPELIKRLGVYPEVQQFTGITSINIRMDSGKNHTSLIKQFYPNLIQKAASDTELFSHLIMSLSDNIQKRSGPISDAEHLFLNLINIYPPTDVGLIMPLFMNLLHLQSGQAVFIPAGIPHAYISGNIIECMANSDNVVRIGLTNKFKDVQTLLKILDFDNNSRQFVEPYNRNGIKIYPTPVEEFYIQNIHLMKSERVEMTTDDKVQIVLVISGQIDLIWNNKEVLNLQKGQSILIPARLQKYAFLTKDNAEVFIATVNY